MDIMRPPLEGRVSPAPWLVTRSRTDAPGLIGKAMTIHPDAGVDRRLVVTFGSEKQLLVCVNWATLKSLGERRGTFEQGSVLASCEAWERSTEPTKIRWKSFTTRRQACFEDRATTFGRQVIR